MDKMKSTAKKLDVFFRILEIVSIVGWIMALVGVAIALVGVGFRMDPYDFGTGYASLEIGFVELDVAGANTPDPYAMTLHMAVLMALCAAFLVVIWRALKQVRRILTPMIQGQPFSGEVGTGLKKLAAMSVLCCVISNIVVALEQFFNHRLFDIPNLLLSDKITQVTVNYEFDLTYLVLAAILLLMSYVFRYGEELQQLSDETL